MEGRRNGALISMENGKAVAFAIFNLQARGEMFVKRNIPLIHVLNIQNLTEELGMAFAPIPLPDIGKGSLYAIEKYNLTVTMLSFLLVSGIVFGVGWRSHQQIKQRMIGHEPDSVI